MPLEFFTQSPAIISKLSHIIIIDEPHFVHVTFWINGEIINGINYKVNYGINIWINYKVFIFN